MRNRLTNLIPNFGGGEGIVDREKYDEKRKRMKEQCEKRRNPTRKTILPGDWVRIRNKDNEFDDPNEVVAI